ncbi:MAG: NTP transferase domain-containing protein, partial [Saprospiraceae bacterium]|nr:NTP transferase domain-containing protein [Saprospiraceae bacterium]
MLQIEAETQTHTLTKNSKSSIKHAVILAAGKSSRFREKGEKLPKVLMKVGGLRLMERSILTLKETGIEHFHIVLGAYRDQIRPAIQKLPRLKDVDINFVECPNYELGNGVSFGAGAAQVNEPFLLTMCDHIFSPLHIQEFTELALEKPHLPALACDPKLNEVFDMDDATKVVSNDGFINDIGKELTEFNLVDTGLFYFPAGYGEKISTKANNGAHSVSNIIQDFIDDTGVRAPALKDPMWQDVDYPGMKKEAEIRLMKYIVSPNDGWVSKNINRFFSTRLSLILANRNVHPNAVTTLVLILSIIGAFFAGSGVYTSIILGAAIFQIASILDGCDGEIARMTYQHSWFGAWYDRLIGNIRFSLFFGA